MNRYLLTVDDAPDSSTFITATFESGSTGGDVRRCYAEIGQLLQTENLLVVQERIFGVMSRYQEILAIRNEALWAAVQPSFFEGKPMRGNNVAGILIRAVPKDAVTPIIFSGQLVGMQWQHDSDIFAILSGVWGTGATPAEETTSLLQRAESIIHAAGFDVSDIARTWFYLDGILDWYDDFNAARTAVYKRWKLVPEGSDAQRALRLPASTGIGVRNGYGKTAAVDILLSKRTGGAVTQLSNAGQKDAFKYGSAFSRGALLPFASGTLMELSGTASIDETGATVYVDDSKSQISCTMKKIDALLSPLQLSLGDLVSGTAFFRNRDDLPLLAAELAQRGLNLSELPLVCVQAHVCRDDLLFELDGELLTKAVAKPAGS
ncbi:MAG: hypothetical protein JXX14_21105 [Deltaproteobacteria bacterium]|nr:hypothetical protein [Deltaproteobacteria bacterium]